MDLFAFKYCALHLSCHLLNKLCFLAHTHVTNCRSIATLDPVDNNSATVHYDFENPIYQAEDGGEEDCEVPENFPDCCCKKKRLYSRMKSHSKP